MKFHSISKYILVLVSITCLNSILFAQNKQLSEEDIAFSRQWEAKLNHALSHSHTERNDKSHHSCLTLVLLEGQQNKKRLTLRLEKILRTHSERIELNFFFDSEHYRFHYDKTGVNAVDITDENNNDVPDYIEFMATEFENVYNKEINELGYVAPPSDGTEGGGEDLYDVYVTDLQQGLYGYVASENMIGDNPNSTVIETEASTSVMRMRNNYDDFDLKNDALKVTAAHEYYHSIQLGYKADFSNIFALEGSASWMEEVIYPRIDDNFQYLDAVFDNPDVAVNYNFGDEDDPDFNDFTTQWYGAWIFFQYIGETYGVDVARVLWENMRSQAELEALDNALKTKGINLQTAFEDFFVANVVLSASSASSPYTYNRAADYINYLSENINSETVKIEGTLDFSNQARVWYSNQQGNGRLMRFSADYIRLDTQEQDFVVDIVPKNSQGKQIGVQFVSFQPNGSVRVIKDYPAVGENAEITIDAATQSEQMYLIVYRIGTALDDFTSEQYSLRIYKEGTILGIDDKLGTDNYFNIASNPVTDRLKFVYKLQNQSNKNYTVSITDILGRKIIENQPIKTSINTNKWAKGTYMVTLFDEKQPIAVRKIIIQ
ncbi:MXAN_6640 family putative metalloprotease [Bernardetia sp.]|uniref:MXAN_6640 family putative metalloprotease n=1 Tax=Bernardetia sp. TaxID=1937974 RepID=UPI0025C5570C|nr:MXAN_6640 family putative metalloprotease [Bernardetia sp.]